MLKLATPVQYESSIEGLNDIRPLQLADEVKIVIPCPALCRSPVTKNKPVVGRLARCSQQGALLTELQKFYTNFEYIEQDFETGNSNKLIEFSQKVSCVQSKVIVVGLHDTAYWTDPTYIEQIMSIYDTQTVFLPFVGTNLYIIIHILVPGFTTTYGFWGFY